MKEKLFYWNKLKFDVSNKNVYQPKPASLLLADIAIKNIKPKERILDMCTGCGIVAIAVTKFVPDVEVFASDINPKALLVVKNNAKLNNANVEVVLSDLCKKFKNNEFDEITIHPPAVPYHPKKDWNIPLGMKAATNGGPDGSRLAIRSIIEAKRCLKKNGNLLLLLPHWCNTKKVYASLKRNYKNVRELARKKVEFFPALEYNPDSEVLRYVYKLAKKGIIKIEFKNNKPYSSVSVIRAIKK